MFFLRLVGPNNALDGRMAVLGEPVILGGWWADGAIQQRQRARSPCCRCPSLTRVFFLCSMGPNDALDGWMDVLGEPVIVSGWWADVAVQQQ